MRGLIFVLLATLASLAQADQPQVLIDVQHDSVRGVTCWITPAGGISCLPDSSLPQQATPKPQKNRASPASATPENGALQAAPFPQDERLQL
jgi:hypothetical protein